MAMAHTGIATKPIAAGDRRRRSLREITGVFAGELVAAHDAGIAQANRQYVREIPHEFDIVVTTNMGYPADILLYQSVKGICAAAKAVRDGGAIILAAECRDGLGLDEYTELLTSEASPAALLERIHSPGFARYDQWGVQVQAMAQAKAGCWLYSAMSRDQVESAHLNYCEDVSATVARLVEQQRAELEREPSLAVLTHGQLTVPVVV
jgi:nickel-dependent lactate racemase